MVTIVDILNMTREFPRGNKSLISHTDPSLYEALKDILPDIRNAIGLDYSWNQISDAVEVYMKAKGVWKNEWKSMLIADYYSLAMKEAFDLDGVPNHK